MGEIERHETAALRTACARDVVQSVLVWITRDDGEARRITLELKREAARTGRTLDPPNDVAPFLQDDKPPLHLLVTSEEVVALPIPKDG